MRQVKSRSAIVHLRTAVSPFWVRRIGIANRRASEPYVREHKGEHANRMKPSGEIGEAHKIIFINLMVVLTGGLLLTGIIGIADGSYDLISWFDAMGKGIIGMCELIIITGSFHTAHKSSLQQDLQAQPAGIHALAVLPHRARCCFYICCNFPLPSQI